MNSLELQCIKDIINDYMNESISDGCCRIVINDITIKYDTIKYYTFDKFHYVSFLRKGIESAWMNLADVVKIIGADKIWQK